MPTTLRKTRNQLNKYSIAFTMTVGAQLGYNYGNSEV